MGQHFNKKVRWNFRVAIHGYGKNCKEALISASKSLQNQCFDEFHENDFEAIEEHETVSIETQDIEEE